MAEIPPHSIQPDRPAKPDVETREDTVERVLDETAEAQNVRPREELVDPTSRRGVNRTIARQALIAAGIGAVAGAVLGVVLSFLPGPVETDSAAGTVGYALVMALLIAIIAGLSRRSSCSRARTAGWSGRSSAPPATRPSRPAARSTRSTTSRGRSPGAPALRRAHVQPRCRV